MFGTLTTDENNTLFMTLHRAYVATDKRIGDLISAPTERFRPVMDTACELTELMADLQAVPA